MKDEVGLGAGLGQNMVASYVREKTSDKAAGRSDFLNVIGLFLYCAGQK